MEGSVAMKESEILELKENNLSKPAFEQGAGSFRIIFKRPSPQATPQVKLTELENKIIYEIKINPKISRNKLGKKLGIGSETVKEYLNKLKTKKVLRRVGKTSAGY